MNIYHDLDEVSAIKNAVVTTGSFDGVHIGHKSILNRLRRIAHDINGESVLITFHPHPRKVLYPETAGKNLFLINSQIEKIELLRKTGLDHLLIIPFTLEFSQISSFDFIRKILVARLHAKKIVVGFNHHFGHNQEGDYEYLFQLGKYHGFEVEEIPEQDIENESVSSTRIRKALLEGKIQRANAYLDHFYLIMGRAVPSPANRLLPGKPAFFVPIEEDCKLIPPSGVYAVSILNGQQVSKGMVIIRKRIESDPPGNHPQVVELVTVNGDNPTASTRVTLNFHKQIREWEDFSFSPETEVLLQRDCKEIEELIF
ncbi:MAG: riboflavin biosynthesis protein RibF [Bacteroidetes bacterium]|nr:riboflavin biosynthesis protein RibF [Bacteroidota bacterium]